MRNIGCKQKSSSLYKQKNELEGYGIDHKADGKAWDIRL